MLCSMFFSSLNLQKIAKTLEIERTHVPLTLLTSLARAIFPPDSLQSKEDGWLNNKIFVVLPIIKIKKSHISWAKIGPYRTWSFLYNLRVIFVTKKNELQAYAHENDPILSKNTTVKGCYHSLEFYEYYNWPIDSPSSCPGLHDLRIASLNTYYNMKAISLHYDITDQLAD